MLPRVADLFTLSKSLSDPKYNRLKRILRQAAVAQSCLSDLKQCLGFLVALEQWLAVPTVDGDPVCLARTSLLMSAVLLYARATGTAGNDGQRGSISIHQKLTLKQREDHDALIKIRNRALAHVYSDEAIDDGVWSKVHMMAVETTQGWLPGGATRTIQLSSPVIRRLNRALPIAIDLIEANAQDKMLKTAQEMNASPVPLAMFEEHRLDPVSVFGTLEAAQNALGDVTIGANRSFYTANSGE